MTNLSQTAPHFDAVPAIQEIDPDWCARLLRPVLEWCESYIVQAPAENLVAGAFRSTKLSAAARSVFPESVHTDWSPQIPLAFEKLLKVRSEERDRSTVTDDVVYEELLRPQSLLITDWRASLFDGAMTPETAGFINQDGLPPWDTWFGLVRCADAAAGPCCLLSWVPQWMADRVNSAIVIDAAESLSWGRFDEKQHLHAVGWGQSWNI